MYEKFEALLIQHNLNANQVAKSTGLNPSTFYQWKKGVYVPKTEKLQKIANYFNVPLEYFTGQKVPTSEHSKKDLIDLNEYLKNTEIMFDGEVHEMDEQDRQKLRTAIEFVFWQAKEKNKRKPKK